MPCEEWYKLLDRYHRAVKSYNQAVDRLGGPDFTVAWQNAEAAWINSNAARAHLLDHESPTRLHCP